MSLDKFRRFSWMVVRFKDSEWVGQNLWRVECRVWMSLSSMHRTRKFGSAIFNTSISPRYSRALMRRKNQEDGVAIYLGMDVVELVQPVQFQASTICKGTRNGV